MIQVDNLPPTLRGTGLFCCWRYEERDGKKAKVPYNPRTGGRAQSTNPDTFAPLPVALAALERGGYDGIGVGVFGSLGAIDIDHCINDAGELSEMAAEIMETMNAYTEYSLSGKGLRILFTVPEAFQYDKGRYYINNQRACLEVYIAGHTNKYVTVTGNALTPGLGLEDRGEQLRVVLERYMVRQRAEKPTPVPHPAGPHPLGWDDEISGSAADLDDFALIEKIKRSRGGARFAALWAGDISEYNGDDSRADLALCNILAWWTNGDAGRVDRLFRQSKLMREKWNRPTAGSTYGTITIMNAVNTTQGEYDPAEYRQHSAAATPGAAGTPLESVKPPDFSDAGNATIFSRLYQNDLVFVDALGWLCWNGRRWDRNDHKALAWAMDLSERMLKEALDLYGEAQQLQADAMTRFAETGDDEDKEAVTDAKKAVKKAGAYLAHAKNLRGATRLRNMMELSKPALVLKADRLDANPLDLNTPAGIVNLTTGDLRPHDRAAYCSQIKDSSRRHLNCLSEKLPRTEVSDFRRL